MHKLSDSQRDELITFAKKAMDNSYSPYSRFRVGAALLTADGSIVTGCNVENSSSPVGICAERTAMATAVAQGKREFVAIAVVSDAAAPISPCGMCRQFMAEFGLGLEVTLVGAEGRMLTSLKELLPYAFDKSYFGK